MRNYLILNKFRNFGVEKIISFKEKVIEFFS